MKKILFAICASALMVGCTTPSFNVQPTITNISKPDLNVVTTAGVGEQMVVQGKMVNTDALVLTEIHKPLGYTIPPGQYMKTGDNEKGQYFAIVASNSAQVSRSGLADQQQALMVTKENELCVVTIYHTRLCSASNNFAIRPVTATSENSFQQTLLYSGKIGNKINISYREFSNNLARPAFNNDVEYDLSESKQIGYKGALIEVINATNQSITYKVLKNFTPTE